MEKKYTLEEFKKLYEVASKATIEDIDEIMEKAIEQEMPDPALALVSKMLIKAESKMVVIKIKQLMFGDSEESEEE